MSARMERFQDPETTTETVKEYLRTVAKSASLMCAAFGGLVILLSATVFSGASAGLGGIYGGLAIVVGLTSYAVFYALRTYF